MKRKRAFYGDDVGMKVTGDDDACYAAMLFAMRDFESRSAGWLASLFAVVSSWEGLLSIWRNLVKSVYIKVKMFVVNTV